MRDIGSMRRRVEFLRRQAAQFRKQGEGAHDPALHDQLTDLAERCAEIAANIERNLPIHERADG